MNPVLFPLVCVPVRSLVLVGAYFARNRIALLLGIVLVLVGILFLYRFKRHSDKERGAFGQLVWWNQYRAIHGITYMLSGVALLAGYNDISTLILFLDVLIGITAKIGAPKTQN